MSDDCTHPVQIQGLCGWCGQTLSDDQQANAISMMHDTQSLTVSQQEARRLDSESTTHLLEQRKLALIVDLDQTIIHASVDPTVGEWLKDESNPNYEALRNVGYFRLGIDGKAILEHSKDAMASGSSAPSSSSSQAKAGGSKEEEDEGCWYYIKPRPGLIAFLQSLAKRYELHVYTMGTRSYANCVCKLVDPDGSLFGTRILSRDENGSLVHKSLSRLFPMDTSMVVIIDDRGDVWGWSPNLVKVIPFDFFVGGGDINATFLPAAPGPSGLPADAPGTQGASPASAVPPSATAAAAEAATSPIQRTVTPSPSSSPTRSSTEALNDAAEEEQAQEEQQEQASAQRKADQSQKSAVSEQLDARPLAKMQEQLDAVRQEEEEQSQSTEASQTQQPDASTSTSNAVKPSSTNGKDSVTPRAQTSNASAPSPLAPPPPPPPPPPPRKPAALLKDDDTELHRVQTILDEIHEEWYRQWDAITATTTAASSSGRASQSSTATDPSATKPTVMDIIAERKKQTLAGCDIVYSSLIPTTTALEEAEYYWLALEYGASCSPEIHSRTTHLIAAKPGTAKVNRAQHREGRIQVVWPCWLHDSIARWEKMPEKNYLLPKSQTGEMEVASSAPSAQVTDDEGDSLDDLTDAGTELQEAAQLGDDGEEAGGSRFQTSTIWTNAGGGLAGMNWAEADEELERYLNDTDGDDEDDETAEADEQGGAMRDTDDEQSVNGQDEGSASSSYTPAKIPRTPSKSSKAAAAKRSRQPSQSPSTTSSNGHASAEAKPSERNPPITPFKKIASSSSADGSEPLASPGKRRRVDTASTASPAKSKSNVPSRPSTPGGASVGDETFLRDLEDEIEAAMGDVEADGDEEDDTGDGVRNGRGFDATGVEAG